MKRRVVVTGCGVVTPLGCELESFWSRLCNGESGIAPITSFDASIFRSQFGGEATDFDPEKHLHVRELGRIERFAQMALASSIDAVEQSGIDFEKEDPTRCGVIYGSGVGGINEIEEQHDRLIEKGPKKVSVFTIPKMMGNAASAHISIQFGLTGYSYGVVSACASASHAIVDAIKTIQYDEHDIVITGGSETGVSRLGFAGFGAMRALSQRNEEPTKASRPFDKDRDGFVMSEGAGSLVLEELEHAKARGANILCELLGYGITSDAGHITAPDPGGKGAGRAMILSMKSAGMNPEDIDYINAHGTSTPLGDAAETAAIKMAFGEQAKKVVISSTKSQIGHLLGASGGVETVISIMSMLRNVVPPTINLETPDPECDLDYTPNVAREMEVNNVMVNSFGFGGHNVVLVLGPLRD